VDGLQRGLLERVGLVPVVVERDHVAAVEELDLDARDRDVPAAHAATARRRGVAAVVWLGRAVKGEILVAGNLRACNWNKGRYFRTKGQVVSGLRGRYFRTKGWVFQD
jgi:hypothetical protein